MGGGVGPDGCLHVVYSYDPDGYDTGDVVNVYYRRSCDNGTTWGDWRDAPVNSSQNSTVTASVELNDGRDNLVKWKALDTLGNGPTESVPYRVLVDTEGVKFSEAYPGEDDISLMD